MNLYEILPTTWFLFVQWVQEDPERAQKAGRQFIERVLAEPKLVKDLQAIMAGAELAAEKAAAPRSGAKRAKREKAVLDPIETAKEGEDVLREKLAGLTRPQLIAILSDYALDPGQVVSRKRLLPPIIDFIVSVSLTRAHKGDGFKS